MDNQEAKFILQAYRANGADAADPAFSEALDQARRDPALSRWLAQEQAFDEAMTRKLRSVTPPAGLRENILTGARVSRKASDVWFSARTVFALAACVAVIAGLSFVWPSLRARGEREQIASLVADDVLHGVHGSSGRESARLQNYLETAPAPLNAAALPVPLHALETTGCRTLSLAGRELAEVCFVRQGKEYHFYVTSRLGGDTAAPKFMQRGDAALATWSDHAHTYLLATTSGVAALKSLL